MNHISSKSVRTTIKMETAFRECKLALLVKRAFKKIICYQKLNKEVSSGAM